MNSKEYCEHKDAVYEFMQSAYKNCEANGTPLSNRQYEFVMDQMIKLRVSILRVGYCTECGKPMDDTEHNYGTPDILCCIHCYTLAQE